MKLVLLILGLFASLALGQDSDFLAKFDSKNSLSSASEFLLDSAVSIGKDAVVPVLTIDGTTAHIDDWARGMRDMRRGAEKTKSYEELRKKIKFEEIPIDKAKKLLDDQMFVSFVSHYYTRYGPDEHKKLFDYIRNCADVSVVKITIFNAQDVDLAYCYLFWKKQDGKWRLQQAASHMI